jgi:hypothetical protein
MFNNKNPHYNSDILNNAGELLFPGVPSTQQSLKICTLKFEIFESQNNSVFGRKKTKVTKQDCKNQLTLPKHEWG